MIETEKRVDRLESALERFTTRVGIEFNKAYNVVENLSLEMKEFKNEMRDFKDEMQDFKDEMRGFKNETNKKWGELANKMGTLVEDIVAPSIPGIIRRRYGVDLDFFGIRVKKRSEDGKNGEFDVIAFAGDLLFINSTKSSLSSRDVDLFSKQLKNARSFFPEYADKSIVGIIASLYVDKSVLKYGEKSGFFVLGMGEELMQILNPDSFNPKHW